ncbi:hypothetical protein [Streptomyces sp. NPDC056069]|uniref:hypothetical protein n=1 Tax=Streptomyces sp. NPDC056069 TaxID=3345702 RepID=UPI0035E023F0
MTQPSPADTLRAAGARLQSSHFVGVRAKTGNVAALLRARAEIAHLLDVASDMVTAYPQMGDAHDRQVCDDFACDLVGRALTVARAILGEQP